MRWTAVNRTRYALNTYVGGRCFSSTDQVHQQVKGRKRFYKHVFAKPAGDEWEVQLDHRPLKTPGRNPLRLKNDLLATLVAAEWDFQTNKNGIEPSTMPLMSLCATAIDQISSDRPHAYRNILQYLRTDTTCFFAPESERILLKRQREHWCKIHTWAEHYFGERIEIQYDSLLRPNHSEELLIKAEKTLHTMNPFTLAAMQSLTVECKSFLIALSVVFEKVDIVEAIRASRIEEDFNIENWGLIEGGHDQDICSLNLRVSAAYTLLSVTGGFLRNELIR